MRGNIRMANPILDGYTQCVLDYCEKELMRNDRNALIDKLISDDFGRYLEENNARLRCLNSSFFVYLFLVSRDILSPLECAKMLYEKNNNFKYAFEKTSFANEFKENLKDDFPYFSSMEEFDIPAFFEKLSGSFIAPEVFPNIESITIAEGVKEVGKFAFLGLSNLKNIYLPASMEVFHTPIFVFDPEKTDLTIWYHPIEKPNGKKGPGFSVDTANKDFIRAHLQKIV